MSISWPLHLFIADTRGQFVSILVTSSGRGGKQRSRDIARCTLVVPTNCAVFHYITWQILCTYRTHVRTHVPIQIRTERDVSSSQTPWESTSLFCTHNVYMASFSSFCIAQNNSLARTFSGRRKSDFDGGW